MNTVFIYALNDPNRQHLGKTRYIGKAVDPYRRYEKHLEENCREKTHKANWIRSLLSKGCTPVLEVLDEVSESEWQLWECEWIRLYRALGFDLTNGTEGGDGLVATPDVRAKISRANKGRKCSSEKRIAISCSLLGRKQKPLTEVQLEQRRLANTGEKNPNFGKTGEKSARFGVTHTPEAREKIRLTHLGRIATEETRMRMGASQRAAWARRKATTRGN